MFGAEDLAELSEVTPALGKRKRSRSPIEKKNKP
jgi:hypothetical protein